MWSTSESWVNSLEIPGPNLAKGVAFCAIVWLLDCMRVDFDGAAGDRQLIIAAFVIMKLKSLHPQYWG
jgi:hypothetical protein